MYVDVCFSVSYACNYLYSVSVLVNFVLATFKRFWSGAMIKLAQMSLNLPQYQLVYLK